MTEQTRQDGNDTVDRLRNDIDSGRTRDKVQVSDPAAAPLGADEEAAGTPVTAERVAKSRRAELAEGGAAPRHDGLGSAWILIGVVVAFATAIVGWGILR
ncbi:hypothetical protein [Rhodoplanes roseus]|uniref:Uncharacterized protein n=1 Tax=Rhodoplanes roseus TaxID=29409 RepID=A0A327L078_9BRAD|nr:hypothetical protein [Rhodoplanes roseus]RAI43787.1 hypothetical protein CH341_12420 [Rhodoplanes roseus]